MAALSALRSKNVEVDNCHYMLFDCLETSADLSALFELFGEFYDQNGRHPVLTANCLSANPDFERIANSSFTKYFFESSLETVRRAKGCENNQSLWEKAISEGVCLPQCHGREHLNIARWMKLLRSSDTVALEAFNYKMFAVSAHVVHPRRSSILAAFDSDYVKERSETQKVVNEALAIFQNIFGFESKSFIAPNYIWDEYVERACYECGVDYIQSGRAQIFPGGEKARRIRRRFHGQRNALGQHYLVRNVDFEPSSASSLDWVDRALSEINIAFKMRKPAVISMHRVNFVGGLQAANRDRGLKQLKELLTQMLRRWPDIEFVDTVELGELVAGKRK